MDSGLRVSSGVQPGRYWRNASCCADWGEYHDRPAVHLLVRSVADVHGDDAGAGARMARCARPDRRTVRSSMRRAGTC